MFTGIEDKSDEYKDEASSLKIQMNISPIFEITQFYYGGKSPLLCFRIILLKVMGLIHCYISPDLHLCNSITNKMSYISIKLESQWWIMPPYLHEFIFFNLLGN